jgi:signal transduction histidine kinase
MGAGGRRELVRVPTIAQQQQFPATPRMWTLLADPRVRIAIAASGMVAAVGGGLLLATSDHLVDPVAYGLQVAVMVFGTVAAALVWLARRPGNRVAPLLLALALATATISLQGVEEPVLHSLGVLADPAVFLLAYVVVFAFPDGRLSGRVERLLLAGWTLYFLVGFVPWFFFSPVVFGGAPLAGCTASCPENGLMIADRPTLAAGFGTDLAWVVIALTSATIAYLVVRLARASRPRRRTLLPVYIPAVMLTIPLLAFHGLAAGVLHLDPDALSKIGWSVTIGRSALAYGFLLAIAQASFFAGGALKRLMGQIGGNPDASRLRDIVADALDDPSVELAFRVDRSDDFVDSRGEPIAAEVTNEGRASTDVERRGETVAVIRHDPALNTDPELMRAASQAMVLALENGRLETALQTRTAELAASRARIVAIGDAERRKVERDLHDGAQQQLVALRIEVELARELAMRDPEVAARLADVGYRLEDVLSELRDLAQGVHPPLLRERGLRAALDPVAQRSTPPANLGAVDGIARYPDDVETAVYYCCLEGLQNVGKHAGPNARADVRLSEEAGELRFEIIDDGVGCDVESARSAGAGLTNMSERVAALGGTLTVDSATGRGTQLRGRIPLAHR